MINERMVALINDHLKLGMSPERAKKHIEHWRPLPPDFDENMQEALRRRRA